MPTNGTPEPADSPERDAANPLAPTSPASRAPDDALAQAIAELRAERPAASGEPSDRYWLRTGIALGLREPGRAALLLGGLEARAAMSDADTNGAPTADADATGEPTADDAHVEPNEVPVRSLLLTRSARLPASASPTTVFGWVAQLSPLEIRRLGHVVTEMLAAGGPRDLERGFALAWSAGTRLPREDLRGLFGRFGELELAICGVLGGRDLLSIARPPDSGASALLSVFVRRSSPAVTEASAILEREGDPARRGLVAIWNAWVALRYRELIAPPLFDQLVRAWVAVVGPVPEA